jgi:lysophospholipase L1-like esterase
MFIGDSIVAGTGDPECRGWAGRVAAASFRSGIELTALNLGIGGDPSGGVLARWREEVTRRINPDIDNRLVAQFGVNDIRDGIELPAEEVVANLASFVRETRDGGFDPLIVGPVPTAQQRESERVGDISRRFADACSQAGVTFIELHAALKNSPQFLGDLERGDGYHPGADGYNEITRAVLENGWWEWLARGSAPPRALLRNV